MDNKDYKLSQCYIGEGNDSVYQTLKWMRYYVLRAKNNPIITNIADELYKKANKIPAKFIELVFEYVRDNIKYTYDHINVVNYISKTELNDKPENTEFLQAPEKLLDPNNSVLKKGDCDDMSMAIAALLLNKDFTVTFKVIGVHSKDFSHVYNEVYLPEVNGYVALDAVIGEIGKELAKPKIIEIMEIKPTETANRPECNKAPKGLKGGLSALNINQPADDEQKELYKEVIPQYIDTAQPTDDGL